METNIVSQENFPSVIKSRAQRASSHCSTKSWNMITLLNQSQSSQHQKEKAESEPILAPADNYPRSRALVGRVSCSPGRPHIHYVA